MTRDRVPPTGRRTAVQRRERLTLVAMCLGVAARIPGSVVQACVAAADGDVRLGHPSGVLPIAARVDTANGEPRAETVTVYRTARRLMEGFVRVA